jgi:hypothetical protein
MPYLNHSRLISGLLTRVTQQVQLMERARNHPSGAPETIPEILVGFGFFDRNVVRFVIASVCTIYLCYIYLLHMLLSMISITDKVRVV